MSYLEIINYLSLLPLQTHTEFKRGSSLISQLPICYYTVGLVAAPSYGLKG